MGKNLKGKECGKGICQRKDGKYAARYTAKDGSRKEKHFDTLPEGASRILCKRTDVVQIEQIISRERSRVQGGHSLGVILVAEMPRVKDQPLNPASCRKRKLRVERGSRSSPGVCRSISL